MINYAVVMASIEAIIIYTNLKFLNTLRRKFYIKSKKTFGAFPRLKHGIYIIDRKYKW